jgi:hypothetical protein
MVEMIDKLDISSYLVIVGMYTNITWAPLFIFVECLVLLVDPNMWTRFVSFTSRERAQG